MRDFNRLIRYLAYVLELLVLFMMQETPGMMPAILGCRPMLILPAALTIAIFEKELPAMAFGIVGGLLLDFGLSGTMGFHALILAVLCYMASIFAQVYLQVNLATAILTGLWAAGAVICLQWLFLYYLQGYSMPGYAFTHHFLPKYFYSLLFFPLAYLLNRGLFQSLQEPGSTL